MKNIGKKVLSLGISGLIGFSPLIMSCDNKCEGDFSKEKGLFSQTIESGVSQKDLKRFSKSIESWYNKNGGTNYDINNLKIDSIVNGPKDHMVAYGVKYVGPLEHQPADSGWLINDVWYLPKDTTIAPYPKISISIED